MRKRLRQQSLPKPWSWKDRLIVGAIVVLLPASTLGIMHITAIRKFSHSLERTLQEMSVEYSLEQAQVDEIRKMETAFHGNGSPFFRLNSTAQGQSAHEIAISEKMTPENAARFLTDQKDPSHRDHLQKPE